MAATLIDKSIITLEWHGDEQLRRIKNELRRNLITATELVKKRIKRTIATWGSSASGIGGTRIRGGKAGHSLPGQPPFRQTGNLYNSIKDTSRLSGGSIIGEIFTDVPYALDMERGLHGVKRYRVKHTNVTLLNRLPITAKPSGRRPFMLMPFIRSRRTIVRILAGKTGIIS